MNEVGKWFTNMFNPEGHGPSESGWYLIALLITVFVLGLAIFILAKVLKRKAIEAKVLDERVDELNSNVTELKSARDKAVVQEEAAKWITTQTNEKLEETKLESSGKDARVHAYEKIFKEALMIANAKSDISIDKSEVLDVMSIDDIRAYAASIGAKAPTSMTKDEMIKSIRAREVALKNIDNARKANSAKMKVKASEKQEKKETVETQNIEPYVPDPDEHKQ
jgi:hypothetical protein